MHAVVIDPKWSEEEKWRVLNQWIRKVCEGGITRENIQNYAIVGGEASPGNPVPIAPGSIEGYNLRDHTLEADKLSEEFNAYIEEAHANAEEALTLTNGKNTVYRQPNEPTGGAYTEGDVWFKTDGGDPPKVIGIYMYVNEVGWVQAQLAGGTIAANSIATQHLAAIDLTADTGEIFKLNAACIKTGILDAIEVSGVYGTFEHLYAGLLNAQGMLLDRNEDSPLIAFFDPDHNAARVITMHTDHVKGYGKSAPWESVDYIGMADYAG